MNYLGKFLKKKLKELKMSEREISAKCGISHSYLNQLIKGINPSTNKKISPTLATFEKLAIGFDVDIEYLQKVARGCMNEKITGMDERINAIKNTNEQSSYPSEIIEQIKDFQEFMREIGLDKNCKSKEEWASIISNLREIVKSHIKYPDSKSNTLQNSDS